ncbi:MAG: hypothetical protein WC718_07135 [Phycisphaerales bacterium]|jgi:hypothetical protein
MATEFVQNGAITPEGQKVIARLEAGIAEALKLEEGQNAGALNALSGPYKHYLVNVQQMGKHTGFTPAQWLKDYAYGAQSVYDLVLAEEKQAAQDKLNEDTVAQQAGLADKIGDLEKRLTEALATIDKQTADMAALQETQTEPDRPKKAGPDTPKKAEKKPKAEGQAAPAETDAEGDEDS